jgi:hypothetical protein
MNNDQLSTTATHLGSKRWSLYACLTVFYLVIDSRWCFDFRTKLLWYDWLLFVFFQRIHRLRRTGGCFINRKRVSSNDNYFPARQSLHVISHSSITLVSNGNLENEKLDFEKKETAFPKKLPFLNVHHEGSQTQIYSRAALTETNVPRASNWKNCSAGHRYYKK